MTTVDARPALLLPPTIRDVPCPGRAPVPAFAGTATVDRPAAAPAAGRVVMFDAMRVAAALAVVVAHTPLVGTPWGNVWKHATGSLRFGVSFFIVAGMILLARSIARRPDQTLAAYASARAARLLPPLAAWSAIYAGFYWAMAAWLGARNDVVPGPGLVLGGAAIHLWFLPFILAAGVAGFPLLRLAQRRPAARRWLLPALAAAAGAAMCVPNKVEGFDRGTSWFLSQAAWSLPTVFAAVAVAMVYPRRVTGRAAGAAAAAGAVAFVVACALAYKGVSSPAIQLAKGVAVSLVALAPWSPAPVRWLARLGTLSFGVYLCHLLFVTLFRELGGRVVPAGHAAFYPAVTVLAFAASYSAAVLANRTRAGKVLFP
ncbi:MAG TPA: acyltransferase family protein [Humisphaera sp.]